MDAHSGTLEAYAEVASLNGNFKGYLKPIIKDLQIVSISEDISNPAALIWEGLFEVITQVFTNQRHDQFATKIPLNGTFNNPELGIFPAIGELILNAYDQALKSDFEKE